MIATSCAPVDDMDVDQPTAAPSDAWKRFLQICGRADDAGFTEKWTTEQSLPFLRSSAILFHFITSIPFPKLDDAYDNFAEAVLWLRYLGVESIAHLVAQGWAQQLATMWCSPLVPASAVKPRPPWRFPVESSGLITLPSDYSELINVASLFTCPNSEGDEARTPAMCLVCGKMLCSQVIHFTSRPVSSVQLCESRRVYRATAVRPNWMLNKWAHARHMPKFAARGPAYFYASENASSC